MSGVSGLKEAAVGGLQRLQPHIFGVRMISPIDFYSLVTRAVKYGVRFLAVFCLELGVEERAQGLAMLVAFAATCGILYLILQLEDYALLAGAILGFVALTIVMFVTLRVDWSGGGARPAPQGA